MSISAMFSCSLTEPIAANRATQIIFRHSLGILNLLNAELLVEKYCIYSFDVLSAYLVQLVVNVSFSTSRFTAYNTAARRYPYDLRLSVVLDSQPVVSRTQAAAS